MENTRDKYKGLVSLGMSAVLLLGVGAVFTYTWYTAYKGLIDDPFFRRGNWLLILIYVLLFLVFSRIYGGFRVGHQKRSEIIYSNMLELLFTNVVTYFQISLIARKLLPPLPMVLMTLGDVVLICIWSFLSSALYTKLYPPREVLLVYGSDLAYSLMGKLSSRRDRYQVKRAISIGRGVQEVESTILKHSSVILCDIPAKDRNTLLKFCYEHSVRVYITPKISDILLRGADVVDLFDTPIFVCRNLGLTLTQRAAKRVLDLIVSSIAAIVASPFMLITALAIKLYDKGPVLYKQKRLTKDGREFYVYKFRSMVVNAEKDGQARLASQNDDRITPVGKFIRKIRFDELPQIFNILFGDMSLVGPRPERPEIAAEYEKTMPEFRFRLKVKAGLTGYAQVMGRYNTTPYDKLRMDLMYIGNYSILLDWKLLFMTIKILFLPESTEGIEDGARTAERKHEEPTKPE
jgi:exopolysaccharide biosynthesis polyprenyl glycosylphosphotransferase